MPYLVIHTKVIVNNRHFLQRGRCRQTLGFAIVPQHELEIALLRRVRAPGRTIVRLCHHHCVCGALKGSLAALSLSAGLLSLVQCRGASIKKFCAHFLQFSPDLEAKNFLPDNVNNISTYCHFLLWAEPA